MNITVIEDNNNDFNYFKSLFSKHFKSRHELFHFKDVESFLPHQNELNTSLMILDMELPGIDGIEFLNSYDEYGVNVLFCTSSEAYALRAFEHQALGYLLKPYNELDFVKSISKALNHIVLNNNIGANANIDRRIAIPSHDCQYFVKHSDIVRLESVDNYVNFHLNNNVIHLSSYGINHFESELGKNFFRTHKSHIINIAYVDRYFADGTVALKNGDRVPLARRRRKMFLDLLS